MGITIIAKMVRGKKGFRYGCDCGDADINMCRNEDFHCYSCDSWRAWPTKDEINALHMGA